MIEIWQECSTFQTISQRLADQVRTIVKKGWFSDLELLEFHHNTHKQTHNTVPDTSSGVKQKQSNEKNCKLRQVKTPHFQAIKKKHYHKNKR